jgi:hypothetical protein
MMKCDLEAPAAADTVSAENSVTVRSVAFIANLLMCGCMLVVAMCSRLNVYSLVSREYKLTVIFFNRASSILGLICLFADEKCSNLPRKYCILLILAVTRMLVPGIQVEQHKINILNNKKCTDLFFFNSRENTAVTDL